MSQPDNTSTSDAGTIAMSIAGILAQLGSGERASLRRLDEDAAGPAYWRLVARHEVPARWAPLVRALAILTPRATANDDTERPSLHDPRRKLGTVLCDGGLPDWPGQSPRPVLSERRLAQLLAAREAQRTILLTRAIRAVAVRRDPRLGIDVADLAFAFLRSNDAGAIAGPYYRRLDQAERTERTAEKDVTDA
ncbi:hypothetical protein [Acuticoccus sp.]|uniref:hypothetical protein n=1 Tax=Acuticoccus sp. TaxID=1904378 RepID=UPI003B516AB1